MNGRVVFHHKARAALRAFPPNARQMLGKALFLVQQGHRLAMPHARAMPAVALRVRESRISYRVFFRGSEDGEILVFHAFVKKTQKTPPLEITLARSRLREMRHA
jgi:phage-related protein